MLEILEDRAVPAIVDGISTITSGDSPPGNIAAQVGDTTQNQIVTSSVSLPGNSATVPGNLDFHDGLAGWNANVNQVAVVNRVSTPNFGQGQPPQTYTLDGSNFALIKTPYTSTTLSLPFEVGQGGLLISLSAFFYAGDLAPSIYYPQFGHDFGQVTLVNDDTNTTVATLFNQDVASVGAFSGTPWTPVQYTLTAPGNYSLQATTGALGFDSFMGLGDIQFVGPPTIDVGNGVMAASGAPFSQNITFTDTGVHDWVVDVNTGSGFTPFVNVPAGTNSFTYSYQPDTVDPSDPLNIFQAPGTYNVVFRVQDGPDGSFGVFQDATMLVNVFQPKWAALMGQTAAQLVTDPVQGATVSVSGTSQDNTPASMAATLMGSAGASVFAGSYSANPTPTEPTSGASLVGVSNAAVPVAFFDIRASGVDDDAALTSTFQVEIDPSVNYQDVQVYYSNDGKTWSLVQADPAFPIQRVLVLDPVTGLPKLDNGKEIVDVIVTYTKNSTPSIFSLHGTVFTVALPGETPVATPTPVVSGPVATLNAMPPVTSLSTTFSSDSGGTFVLRVSQGTELSASRTEASTSAASTVTGGNSQNDAATAQDVQNLLNTNWLLRALMQPDDGNNTDGNPTRPATGDDQQNRPMRPMNPEIDDQGSEESVPADAVDAMFATQYEETDLPLGDFSSMTLQVEGHGETRLSAGWALMTAAIGIGAVSRQDCRQHGANANRVFV